MSENDVFEQLKRICGSKNVITDPSILNQYSTDASFYEGISPDYIFYPSSSSEIENVIKLANQISFHVIPISSSLETKIHGDTLPRKQKTIILNLAKMNDILSIDRKNRVVMVEPGVTFEQIIPILKKKGVRLLMPLHPRAKKSVLTTALERVPITIPRYHWDSSDPLLCTEVVFGTGDLFRTGTAAGPGTIKEQKKGGQAQVNPMGPTHFSPFRVLQGAEGSLGVVTWASLKLELIPSNQKVFHFQSENLDELMKLQNELLKYRLCDELFILNDLNLASLVKPNSQDINTLTSILSKWNLLFIISGNGTFAQDKISYLEGDILDIIKNLELKKTERAEIIDSNDIIKCVSEPASQDWRTRLKGGFQDIFFLTNYERVHEFISMVEKMTSVQFGAYIQPINQGTSYYCEFDLFYDPKNGVMSSDLKKSFLAISQHLIEKGAFFNRPYGLWAKPVFENHEAETITALKKVKNIFDPNHVLNPGVLCFDD